MSVKSMFEFRFPETYHQEGFTICTSIGHDMTLLEGYLDHEVIADLRDPGHFMVNTSWKNEGASTAVLSKYQNDDKIKRATELIGGAPSGFVGAVLPKTA